MEESEFFHPFVSFIPVNSHALCVSLMLADLHKIVISCIQTNFSHLTDNSEYNCLITD